MVALHNGTVWGTQSIFYWPFLYINTVASPSGRETMQDIKKQSAEKKTFTGVRIIRPDGYFVYGGFCTTEDVLSVWTILSKYLSFVRVCVPSIKRDARHIMPLDELPFVMLLERRTTSDSSSGRRLRLVTVLIQETHFQTNSLLSTHLSAIALATSSFALANSRRSLTY